MVAAAAAAVSSVPCRTLSCGGSAVAAALPFRRARPCASIRRSHLPREHEAPPYSSCRRVEASSSPLGWVYLGRVPYRAGLALQEALVEKRLDVRDGHPGEAHFDRDVLLLLEHPPTYTAGKRLKGKVDQCESNRLRNLGADFVEVPRGGQTTYHGPGQLVGYPLLDLTGNKLPTRSYVANIEALMIETCRRLGLAARTTEHTGVWVGGKDCPGKAENPAAENTVDVNDAARKIGAIGIHVTRGISQHGFALNVSTDLGWFDHIVACGLPGLGTTSIVKEYRLATSAVFAEVKNDPARVALGNSATVESTVPAVVEAFSSVFGRPLVPLADSSPELGGWIRKFLTEQSQSLEGSGIP